MVPNEDGPERLLSGLRMSLQAHTMDAPEQLGLFPAFVSVTDELAEDFHNWAIAVLDGALLNDDHSNAVRELDDLLGEMTEAGDDAVWTDDGLVGDERWARVRSQAGAALDDLGWPREAPPKDRAVFVRSRPGP